MSGTTKVHTDLHIPLLTKLKPKAKRICAILRELLGHNSSKISLI